MAERVFIVTEEDCRRFKRLDHFLVDRVGASRNFLKGLFERGLIEGGALKKMPPAGTRVAVDIPPPLPSKIAPENLPLNKVFEDRHLLVVDKAAGMVVHPSAGHPGGTLANAVLYHCPDLAGVGQSRRPGLVHRLDKGTSGLMVVAKDRKCHEELVLLFAAHDIRREYLALCAGEVAGEGTLESTIGRDPRNRLKMAAGVAGKRAVTRYRVLENFGGCSFLRLSLETGRTHQIRVHLSQLLKAPVFMDPLYGRPREHLKKAPLLKGHLDGYPHPLLHAGVLGFTHPITNRELFFKAAPPEIFAGALEILS